MRIEISIPSSHMFLGVPDAVIQEIGSELPFSQAELDELSTSVIEACTNAIEHATVCRKTFSPSSSSNSRSIVSR